MPRSPIEAPHGHAAYSHGSTVIRAVPAECRDWLAVEPDQRVPGLSVPIVELGLGRHPLLRDEDLEADSESGSAIRGTAGLLDGAAGGRGLPQVAEAHRLGEPAPLG